MGYIGKKLTMPNNAVVTGPGITVGIGIANQEVNYVVLGKKFKMTGNFDYTLANTIALINVLGKPYYDELKKQDAWLPDELEAFLKVEFKVIDRDNKINEIISNKPE